MQTGTMTRDEARKVVAQILEDYEEHCMNTFGFPQLVKVNDTGHEFEIIYNDPAKETEYVEYER